MKLSELSHDELECMAYDEIAAMILEESGKKQKLLDLHKKICKLLKINYEENADRVSDLFELLSINKKFVMLDNGYWDLQKNHKVNIIVENHEEEDLPEIEDDIEDEIEEESVEEDIFYEGDDTDDTTEDDLKDLVVVDDSEDEEASI